MTSSNNNSGCLSAILKTIGLKPYTKDDYTIEYTEEEILPYRIRDNFLSPAELKFYHELKSIVSPLITILSKIRLADIFYVMRPNENFSYFNQIAQKHVDFLLFQPESMQPLLGIELDDSSHNKPSRQKRDEFVNNVFDAANLPLLHIPVQRNYDKSDITKLINQYLITPLEISKEETIQTQFSDSKPKNLSFCTNCGNKLIVKTAKKGKEKGNSFLVCSDYKKCKTIFPIN
jgi:hypothetical protein